MKKITLKLFTLFFLVASMLSITPALGGLFVSDAKAVGITAAMSNQSYNVSSNSLTRVMCNALRIVTGTAGKTFAAFAIIAVGIGFFSGKVSWGLMIGCYRRYRCHVWGSINCCCYFWSKHRYGLPYQLILKILKINH